MARATEYETRMDAHLRLLAAAIAGACDHGDPGCVARAKRVCRYYGPEDIDVLANKDDRISRPRTLSERFDVYWRLIVAVPVQNGDAAVHYLTGHDREWWIQNMPHED